MNCTKCGESALGVALDGLPYCHRTECILWKVELQRYRDLQALPFPAPQRPFAKSLVFKRD